MIEPNANKEFIEELPRPPAYFKVITASTAPPPIPSNADELAQKIYGGSCSSSQLPLYQNSDTMEEILYKDPKDVLKKSLKHIMQDLLSMLTVKSHDERDIVANSVAAKNSIAEFNKLLNVYRKHAAKQELLETLTSKLEGAKHLETQLQQCLDRSREQLQQLNTTAASTSSS